MSELQIVAVLKVHEGQLEEFKATSLECMQKVRDNDTGTYQYDWYFTADMGECTVIEKYRDSEALLEHIANLGETLATLLSVSDLKVHVFGEPSAELVAATEGMDVTVHGHFQSL